MTDTHENRAGANARAETIAMLEAARPRRPELSDTLDLHIEILHARERVAAQLEKNNSQVPGVRSRAAQGADTTAVTDWDAFTGLFRTICEIAARHRPDQAEVFQAFARFDLVRLQESADAYLRGDLNPSTWLGELAVISSEASAPTVPAPPAEAINLAVELAHQPSWPDLLGFVLNNTLHPFLRALRVSAVNEGYARSCPVCGGEPDFAALEKESGMRRLLCSRCDAEWTYSRTTCPFCGEEEPAKLGYYPSADGAYRLYVCDQCGRYLKTIDLRELARPVNLPAERILTIQMDLAAQALATV